MLGILEERGHEFDASTLPSYLGPLARMYYFRTAKLSAEERDRRKELFGRFSDGLRPVKPYYWDLPGGKRLLEIPVTTMPVFKTPFHFSYLVFLAGFSETLMTAYLRVAILACRMTGTEPSFLLHPLDIIGGDQVPELAFFPGMDVPSARKTLSARKGPDLDGRTIRVGADGRACAADSGARSPSPSPSRLRPLACAAWLP